MKKDNLKAISDALGVREEDIDFAPIKHEGRATYRLKSNPLEQVFANQWRELNNRQRGVLEYLLAENPNYPRGEMTQRDATVAATVIQWLGSPLGQLFLGEVKKHS
ncbi:MAG: hypothetical protein ACYS7Y_16015 [Planctomycetota bacterium]|jgi:hypothetical protein